MDKHQKGELAKKILLAAAGSAAIATVVVLPGLGILFKMLDAKDSRERQRIKQALKQLEAKKVISRRIVKGRERYVVTKYGKDRIDKYLMADLNIPREQQWDGRWRILMFDIPEKNKGGRIRRDVSAQIKIIGMHQLQNSVFISPWPCYEQLNLIANYFKVKKYFVYIEADIYEGTDNLLKKFELQK